MNSSTSSDWYVQLADREIGPLTVEQLAGLARDGQLLAADKVRSGGSGEWVTATNVKGLVFASRREEVREGASVASMTAASAESDIPWYVKIQDEVIGPLSEAELARLAESGAINAHSPTRQGPEGSWTSAGQIRWLSLRPPSSSPPITPSASSKSAPSQADQQATQIEPSETNTSTRSASETRQGIVDFVIEHADELSGVPGVKEYVEVHGRLSKQVAEAREWQNRMAKAKREYEPLEQRVDKCRQTLKDAEAELTKLHRPLGEAAFNAFLASDIDEQPIFAERLAIHKQVQVLKQESDRLAPGSDAGFVPQAKAKAQQLAIIGKIKLEELKFGGLHTKIGREIVEGELDESIRCDMTAQLLSQLKNQRDGIASCSAELTRATTTLGEAEMRLSKNVGLASIGSSRNLDAAIKLCVRDIRKHESDLERAVCVLVETLQRVHASALPQPLLALLGGAAKTPKHDFARQSEELKRKGLEAVASAKKQMSGTDNWTKIALSVAAILVAFVAVFVALVATTFISLPVPQVALHTDSLAFASMTVHGQFTEADQFSDDVLGWTGSAFVYERSGDLLYLYTNRHVLGIEDLAQAVSTELDGSIEISAFQLSVAFPSGDIRPVNRMAIHADGKDIARLEVSASRLVEGTDYVIIPFAGSTQSLGVKPGDDVIAVGSPLDPMLQGTQTFGRVSAVRPIQQSLWIQHDAPISHGNSGGPLFLKRDNKLHWVGINTLGFEGGNSLGFAISCQDAVEGDYLWADATPAGAASVFTNFGISATVVE